MDISSSSLLTLSQLIVLFFSLEMFYYFLMHACLLSRFSCVQLFVTLWTVAGQAPLSMGFSRQECWSGLPCPASGGLPYPGIQPTSLLSPPLVGRFFSPGAIWETQNSFLYACH